MITSNFQNTEIEGDDEFDGTDATIDETNLGFLFDIVSKQMYRRPINSIVREITSNCFDSHIEAKVDDPVVIRFGEDDGGYYIIFKDVGIGISPDRMKNIYSKYFSSSKRDTNDQIGMFGLGSKSPLAYNDHFFLTTISEGIKYDYMIHAGAKVPRIQLLVQEESKEHNGTEVKLYIKNQSDLTKFIAACESELVYFDNVYIDCPFKEFNNAYKILEYETFKYRNKGSYSGYLHIAIGKVAYTISWTELGIKEISFPAALKFNIGDLSITPERESIRYIDIEKEGVFVSTKKIILDKIEEFKKEIISLYQTTKEAEEFEDYQEFHRAYSSRKAYLKLEDAELDITSIVGKPNISFPKLKDFTGKYPREPLNLFYQLVEEYRKGRAKPVPVRSVSLTYGFITQNLCITRPLAGKIGRKKLEYIRDLALKLTGSTNFYVVEPLNLVRSKTVYKYDYTQVLSSLDLVIGKSKGQVGVTYQYKLFKDFVKSEYNRLVFNFESIIIPEDWLRDWRARNAKHYSKDEGDILVYDYGKALISESKTYINPSSLHKFTGFIIYGFEEDEYYLRNFRELLSFTKYGFYDAGLNSKMCRLYKIAKRNEKYFLEMSNAIHVHNFMGNNKIFKRLATTAVIIKESKAINLSGVNDKYGYDFKTALREAFPPVAEAIDSIEKACKEYGEVAYTQANSKLSRDFYEEIIQLAEQYNLYDTELYTLHQRLERYVEGLELVNYILFRDWKILPYFVDFLILKGKKVDSLWTAPTDTELQLIKESKDKLAYLVDTYSMSYTTFSKVFGVTYKNHISSGTCEKIEARSKELLDIYNALTNYHGTKTAKAN